MECRVLHLSYDANDKPIVLGADQKHGVIKEATKWWTGYKPAINRRHPLLCFLWEEDRGLFGVFAEANDWSVIDPKNVGIVLADYYATHTDWKTCRYDGSDIVTDESGTRRIDVIGETFVTEKLAIQPSEANPITIGTKIITKIYPSVASSIGVGNRIIELGLHTENIIEVERG